MARTYSTENSGNQECTVDGSCYKQATHYVGLDARSIAVSEDAGAEPTAQSIATTAAASTKRPLTPVTTTVLPIRLVAAAFPFVEQAPDVMALCVAERHDCDDSPRLQRIVVRDRRLEALALRSGLTQLAPQPPQE